MGAAQCSAETCERVRDQAKSNCSVKGCTKVCKNMLLDELDGHPAMMEQKLLFAARDGDVKAVRQCIAGSVNMECRQPLKLLTMDRYQSGVPVHQCGFTALMYAAQGGYQECVSVLLDARANANARDEDGTTTLHLAAASGELSVFAALLAGGAQITLDEQGQEVLDYLPTDVRRDGADLARWTKLVERYMPQEVVKDHIADGDSTEFVESGAI
mmetsp:Transcript_52306/g.150694  ORF Transcript_52306/g.150694 Transcript_52306/m.150694 type:complete len:214 (-) Transcript_52306:225-866(-)